MTRQSPSKTKKTNRTTDLSPAGQPSLKNLQLLVVDSQSDSRSELCDSLSDSSLTIIQAQSLAEAHQQMQMHRFDVALIHVKLHDGDGVELACEMARSDRAVQTILLADTADFNEAVKAMRLGVSDLLVKPVKADVIAERLREAICRRQHDLQEQRKYRKLQRLCKKLDKARQEVTEQVDILCNDLVTAYQELAEQMQQVVHTSEYTSVVRDELDLESLLRRTLEFIIQKAGPTNAALFLPSNSDEFTLGGYVNFDCAVDSADILLQHLADVVAPRIAQRSCLAHITDEQTLRQWMGEGLNFLNDNHLLGVPCEHQGESLAVLLLFRESAHPYDSDMVEAVNAIAPLMGEYLARIIRVHHRAIPEEEQADDGLMF